MVKKLKGKASDDQATINVIEVARQIWLAGLGAFATAEAEGSKLFDMLVKEGEAVEARGRRAAEETLESVMDKANDTWDRLEQVFQERVASALSSLGVPTHQDIEELTGQINTLHESIKELTEAEGLEG